MLIKTNDQTEINKFKSALQIDYLVGLSQKVAALAQEGLYVPKLKDRNDLSDQWFNFVSDVDLLISESIEVRNRFRRLYPPRMIYDLADMIIAFAIERGVTTYRKRKNIS